MQVKCMGYKKLACFDQYIALFRHEAQLPQRDRARFVSLTILLSHSRSLKVIRNYTVEYGVCISKFHWNYVCICTVSEIFSVNGVTLKPKAGVVQDYWKMKMVPFDKSYTTILHLFRDKARYWPKIVIFYTHCIRHPRVRARTRWSIAIRFGTEKLHWCGWLPDGGKSLTILSRFDRIPPWCDSQMDGLTDWLVTA